MFVRRLGCACAAAFLLFASCSLRAQQPRYTTTHRDSEHALTQTMTGGSAKLRTALNTGRSALSIVSADFDQDGTRDLVTGYRTASGGALLLQRGNPRALAPTETETALTAAGQFVVPYAAKSEVIPLPVSPSLLVSADFAGHGHQDLLAAAKGDSTVYYLAGHGDGSFSAPQTIALSGSISALTVWTGPSGDNLLVAGVCGAQGCGLQFVDRDGVAKAFVATAAAVTAIQTGTVKTGSRLDLALLAGGKVLVLDGDSALKAKPTLETLPVAGAAAIALGTFVPDRHSDLQIAVLGLDATLHVIARAGVDASYDPTARRFNVPHAPVEGQPTAVLQSVAKRTGQPWTEAETVPNVGPGGAAIMLRARLSGSGNDDLAVMAGSQYVTVAHPIERTGTHRSTTPVVTVDSTSEPVTAAIAARLSPDARLGIVTLAAGAHPLTLSVPAAYHTFNVTTIADDTPTAATTSNCITHGACSLRDAITAANKDRNTNGGTGVDTINIPPGIYVLSANNVGTAYDAQAVDYNGSVNIHLDIDAGMNLVGISGCTNSGTPSVPTSCAAVINANLKDVAISIGDGAFYDTSFNDYQPYTFDAFISNLTITNGYNPNVQSSTNCQKSGGFCDFNGGNMFWVDHGASNLTINNVLITNGVSTQQGGGGLEAQLDSSVGGQGGTLEIDNSSFTNNQAPNASNTNINAEGGGALIIQNTNTVAQAVPLILTNDSFSGNTAAHAGGAVQIYRDSSPSIITNSLFTNNTSGTSSPVGYTYGGGLWVNGVLTMTGNTLTGNKAYGYAGGLYLQYSTSDNFAQTVNSNNIVNNQIIGPGASQVASQEDGAGACVAAASGDSASTAINLHYNRFHGNTGGVHTGLGVGCASTTSPVASVNATDNWWGCIPTTATNGTAGTIAGTGCDTAGILSGAGPTLNLSPYTTLTLGLNATTINAGSSVIATASLGQDSSGTVYTAANDGAYNATTPFLPSAIISAFTLTNTATPTYSPSSSAFSASANTVVSYATATATGTANATGTGTATVTVDGATVTRTYSVIASDQTVSSTHTGNFKAGDTADTYSITVSNVGTGSTSGTVTVTDALPAGFTATAATGTNWTCSTGTTVTCTSTQIVSSSITFPTITITVSIASTDAGTYTNNVAVFGGGETNTSNNNGTDSTVVIGAPTITEAFSPATIAPNATSTVTFTLGNPSANSVSLTGVAFSDPLQTSVKIVTAATTTCTGGTATGAVNGTTVSLSGATIAAGATCTVTAGVTSPAIGSYPDTTGSVTATNSNAGGTGSATLTVTVTPTRLVYTAAPATPITAGGNAGTITVALEDAAGNIATNDSTDVVTLQVTSAGYSQIYNASVANGVATFSQTASVALTAAGSYNYAANGATLTAAQATELVNAGAFAALSGAGPTSFSAPGQTGSIAVKAVDSYGNTVPGFTGTVTLTSNDALATLPAAYTYTASDAGVHTFTYSFGTAGTARTLTATTSGSTISQTGIIVNDCILFINSNGTLSRLTDAGIATSPAAGYTGGGAPSIGIALDAAGSIWSVNTASNILAEFSKTGTALSGSGFTGGGLNAPNSLAVDGLGFVWVVNGSTNAGTSTSTLSLFTNAGAAVTNATNFITLPGGTGANAIAIDASGNLWITNATSNTVTEILGGAAPTSTLALGAANATTGARP